MNILHTESSNGWGGQEMRILKEAIGMRSRGHSVIFAVQKGGKLISYAREAGFIVYEIAFSKLKVLWVLIQLLLIFKKHKISIVNTHSSLDAWLGGISARIGRKKIIRTRHLSTSIRKGLNSRILYKWLADQVVTTSSQVVSQITKQAGLSQNRCRLIATGVDLMQMDICKEEVTAFRNRLGVSSEECLVGTACVLRSWKGIEEFLQAAKELSLDGKNTIRWVVIGGGYIERFLERRKELGLEEIVHFTGHLENPYPAIAALDLFVLLSTAHEGISQATLQAAALSKPLITTNVGGLPEVCISNCNGIVVPPFDSKAVAKAILALTFSPETRKKMGKESRKLVENKFTLSHMLDQMEQVYTALNS